MSKKYGTRPQPMSIQAENAVAPKRARAQRAPSWVKHADRPFVVWDGEGDTSRPGKPQRLILFGAFDGLEHHEVTAESLTTSQCLTLIMRVGKLIPDAIHVGFAFGYDVNMILKSLTVDQFRRLAEHGSCLFGDYRIEHIPGKWLRITERGPAYKSDPKDKHTVTIYDVWGYFQSSFLAAINSTLKGHPLMTQLDVVKAGKDARGTFSYENMDYVRKYWAIENELCHALVNKLREYLYDAGLHITQWHGPGSLASFAFRKYGIVDHKADCGDAVYAAARYAYAGGRFERFRVGRFVSAYGYDINSAYPNAISRLPSLSEGQWTHTHNPRRIVEFGVYRVELRGPVITKRPSPLFHRDDVGNVTFPWRVNGWYWTPEVEAMMDTLPNEWVRITEGYEYTGWTTRPFAFVKDVYEERRQLKAAGNGVQMAYKLLLNSLYGKMAQRAGWERTGNAPRWHQLEWAGWVTSYTRAMLYRLMHKIPFEKLIAVETDGIYTTATPGELGIVNSKVLGGWEVTYYDEITYLQSGVYAFRQGTEWGSKLRGLDRDSFGQSDTDTAQHIVHHSKRLRAIDQHSDEDAWPPIVGKTTRFIGYRNAIFREVQHRGPMKVHHRVWETEPREIDCGAVGKRVHAAGLCDACTAGLNAYERSHDTVIRSRAFGPGRLDSQPHDIPWLDESELAKWRERARREDGYERIG